MLSLLFKFGLCVMVSPTRMLIPGRQPLGLWLLLEKMEEGGKGGKERKTIQIFPPTDLILPSELHSFALGFWSHESIWFCKHLSLRIKARSERLFFFQILEKKNMWEYQIQEIGQNKNKKQEGFCAARTGLAHFQSSLDANHKQYMGNHYGNQHASWFCYGNPKEKAKEMSFFILWWEENLLSVSPEIDFLPWLSFYPENSEKEREPMTII